ncbi:MAG: ABC transporter substrate-binding protein [Nitrospinota bacterium]
MPQSWRELRHHVAAFLAALLWLLPLGGRAAGAEKVALSLNWIPTGIHAPLFFARERGYWSRAGLEVRIESSRGSGDAISKLVRRKVHFALAETAALIEGRSQGQPLVGVFLLFDRGPSAILALERSGIRSLRDLAGRTIGAPRASFPRLLFPDLAQAAGLDLGRVKWKDFPPRELLPSLLAGMWRRWRATPPSLPSTSWRPARRDRSSSACLMPRRVSAPTDSPSSRATSS